MPKHLTQTHHVSCQDVLLQHICQVDAIPSVNVILLSPKAPKMAIFGVSGASGATFWGPSRSKLTPLDVFDNVQLCSNRAIGGAYGQKWAFSSKNGRFRSLGPPGATFWGAQRPKQTTLDVLYNVQPCPTNVQPIWICWRCLWPKMAFLDPN